jgi:hypothetical protein
MHKDSRGGDTDSRGGGRDSRGGSSRDRDKRQALGTAAQDRLPH